ncbi:Uncharacterized protein PBTT_05092 [Plasmodiophora brassicae]|uniref:Uncharacterized protein n=1 Tax=Plasmodiophora brassicae TaxID=37360 RepID=A0A0G4IWL4_PLABS|nr:hypothetical protein PBRA_007340 [Plasmodiophora brassicae]
MCAPVRATWAAMTLILLARVWPEGHGYMVIVEPPDSPFAGIRMRSVPWNRYLGPQGTDPVLVNVTAEIIIVNGDHLCQTDRDIPDEVRGRVVVLTSFGDPSIFGCPKAKQFAAIQNKGAAAWIQIFRPGSHAMIPFDSFSLDRRYLPNSASNNMVFVAVEAPGSTSLSLQDYLLDSGRAATTVVSIQPDVNDWDEFYPRWYVQLLIRWIPATILGTATVFAAWFLYKHWKKINAKFDKLHPVPTMRTRRRRLKHVRTSVSTVHLILVIELVTTFVLFLFVAIGGWQSNDLLPLELTHFFVTGLAGWGFTCDVLSAVLWTNLLKATDGTIEDTWLGTYLERYPLLKLALCCLPVLLDTASSAGAALYIALPSWSTTTSTLILILQLAVGIQFLVQSLRFQSHAKKIMEDVSGARQSDPAMDSLLRRLNTWTFLLSLAMIAFVCFVPIGGTMFFYTLGGWVVFWSGAGSARGLTSLCRVMLAQPTAVKEGTQMLTVQTSPGYTPK